MNNFALVLIGWAIGCLFGASLRDRNYLNLASAILGTVGYIYLVLEVTKA